MITGIQFNDRNKFDHTDDNNIIDIMTKNCIILCEDVDIKRFLYNEIVSICTGKYADNDDVIYDVEPFEEPKLTNSISYYPTSILEIDHTQRIILTVEAPFILTATDKLDIWFAVRTMNNVVSIYPFKVFKGHQEDWDKGVYEVYKNVIWGRFSPYSYNKDFDPDDALYPI